MEFSKTNIWVITDGSEGMISQVLGLAQQFSSNITKINTKVLFPWSKLQPGFLPIFSWIFFNKLDFSSTPDMVISCGRKSVYLSLFLKKKFNNLISIHIQNPKINFRSFDYIIAPNHDGIKGDNVIPSIGALHKFTNSIIHNEIDSNFKLPTKKLISIIVGGENNHYQFSDKEANKLFNKIRHIKKTNPEYQLLIIGSRRTKKEINKVLEKNLKDIAYIWNNDDRNPYTFALKNSDFFIVTSDSTSMISECAFTGKPIFIFHLPFKRKSKRIENFHQEFTKLNITKELFDDLELKSWNYTSLNEAERIASILKKRIIKD